MSLESREALSLAAVAISEEMDYNSGEDGILAFDDMGVVRTIRLNTVQVRIDYTEIIKNLTCCRTRLDLYHCARLLRARSVNIFWRLTGEGGQAYKKFMWPRVVRARSRIAELGRVGVCLAKHIALEDLVFAELSTDMRRIDLLGHHGMKHRSAAYSLLVIPFPMQIGCNDAFIGDLANEVLMPLPKYVEPIDLNDKEARMQAFPLKSHPGASNKVNVYLSESLLSIDKISKHVVDRFRYNIGYIAGKVSDDVATGCLMSSYCLDGHVDNSTKLCMRLVLDPAGCKSLTTVIKSLGLNSHLVGAMLCEAQALQGRGTPADDAVEDREYRVSKEGIEAKVHTVDKKRLRDGIRYVYDTELLKEVEYESKSDFWTRRWMWCVNGAHAKGIERIHPELAMHEPDLKKTRIHRKVFSEHVSREVLSDWDGRSFFSQSLKLEAGKTRYIYACDTITYFAFEYLLRPVENAWLNRRVVLDPGALGTYGMARRIRRMQARGGVNVMLDFDDYNARHRNEYMAMVFEELLLKVPSFDKVLGQLIVDSFNNSYMLNPGSGAYDRVAGTLMSGHRATTFINSVLNYAYLHVAHDNFKSMQSMHIGDDVYVLAASYREAYQLLWSCEETKLAMNPMKQSVGIRVAEFLRIAHADGRCFGYVMRSIASTIAGNWVNEIKLDFKEGLDSIVGASWTIANRSANLRAGLMLLHTLKRMGRISTRVAESMLIGESVRDGGPCRMYGRDTIEVEISYDTSEINTRIDEKVVKYANAATSDYVSFHAHPAEVYAATALAVDMSREMKRASYAKTMRPVVYDSEESERMFNPRVKRRKYAIRGLLHIDDIWNRKAEVGVLSTMPIMNLIKNGLNKNEVLLQDVLAIVTGTWYRGQDLQKIAWGTTGRGCAIRGFMSWSDSGMIAQKCDGQCVACHIDCFV